VLLHLLARIHVVTGLLQACAAAEVRMGQGKVPPCGNNQNDDAAGALANDEAGRRLEVGSQSGRGVIRMEKGSTFERTNLLFVDSHPHQTVLTNQGLLGTSCEMCSSGVEG
jgi:hypothetical protein